MKKGGYGALIERYGLRVPDPSPLTVIGEEYEPKITDDLQRLTPKHAPRDNLGTQLEFALKWEGVNLAVLAALFQIVPEKEIRDFILETPTGAYTRRTWFLWEWLSGKTLDIPDLGKVRSLPLLDPELHYGLKRGESVSRHKITNNLPGTREFCPLVRRIPRLEEHRAHGWKDRASAIAGKTHPDVIARAAAFLLLSDSRASFTIEGEHPPMQRIARWGEAIAGAGKTDLSRDEFERLQRLVIGDSRFVHLGLRTEGGFVGQHDRLTQAPIPEHISARAGDLPGLINGVIAYDQRALAGELDPVIAAASVAFGFVYIHPFEDGNGRLHRWLIHHVLARAGYNPPELIFPVSSAILRHIDDYHRVLRSYSRPLLKLIEWQPTLDGNVDVRNDTSEYYRFFDATRHAEFLYRCVAQTVEEDLPNEVKHLQAYDRFVQATTGVVDMPNRKIDLLWRFLTQNGGVLSKRALGNEFAALKAEEVRQVEDLFRESWPQNQAYDVD